MTTTIETSARPRRSVWRRLLAGALGLATVAGMIAYLGISVVVAERVTRPSRTLPGNCADYGLTCEDVVFTNTVDNIRLEGWFVDAPGDRAIMVVHGRDGVRDDKTADFGAIMKGLHDAGYDVLTFDMRAHGRSGGERYSLGQWETRDVAAAVDYLKSRGVTQVGALGFSMGGATVLNAAPDLPALRAVAVDSSFARLTTLLGYQLPKASGLPALFNPGILLAARVVYGVDIWGNNPVERLAQLGQRPVLLIQSSEDDEENMVPVSELYVLQAAGHGNPNLQVWAAPGRGHIQSFKNNPQEYLRRVTSFFDSNLQ